MSNYCHGSHETIKRSGCQYGHSHFWGMWSWGGPCGSVWIPAGPKTSQTGVLLNGGFHIWPVAKIELFGMVRNVTYQMLMLCNVRTEVEACSVAAEPRPDTGE
jgi:hypothetical protein